MGPTSRLAGSLNLQVHAMGSLLVQGDLVWGHCGLLHSPGHWRKEGPAIADRSGAHTLAVMGLVYCHHQLLAVAGPEQHCHLR